MSVDFYRYSTLWQYARLPSGGGWSESVIVAAGQPGGLAANIRFVEQQARIYIANRIELGTPDVQCVGCRVTPLQIPGARPTIFVYDPPFEGKRTTAEAGVGFVSIELLGVSANGTRRVFRFPGVPNSYSIAGKLSLPSVAMQALNTLIQICSGSYAEAIDRTQPLIPIVEILATGQVRTASAAGFTVGSLVQLFRVTSATGQRLSGTKSVSAATPPYLFTVTPWTHADPVYQSGSIRQFVPTFNQLTTVTLKGIAERKIGRPFGLPRGRKFARRLK